MFRKEKNLTGRMGKTEPPVIKKRKTNNPTDQEKTEQGGDDSAGVFTERGRKEV